MKYILLCILFSCILLSGFSKIDITPRFLKSSAVQTQSQAAAENLRIISSNANIRHGDFGFITIQGRPETEYKIATSYRRGNRVISVTQWRVTGQNGQATFNWVVDAETVPGTYSAVITGGGEQLTTYHTILP